MTSAQIRQSFLDFFREKQHTIVPSSSLLPDAPNLLFTNAGMNQFVPIFLGQQKPPWNPPRVADTQKCIRAGGKHNDLEDVGLDTYHHTFFEMLGNWSFGDYFKKEAIEWAWELLVKRWGFRPERLYATVYCPYIDKGRWDSELEACIGIVKAGPARVHWEDKLPGESAIDRSDREAIQYWANVFIEADLEPTKHIIPGGRADNFWMMGDTGPCGPCSEIHVDLTPEGSCGRELVNKNDPRCIEIWNLVFIQFNANPDGTFTPLPQRHVDTGMGFERTTAIIQGTKGLIDFSGTISNYETDIFRPIFDELEKLSGKKYGSTLPVVGQAHRLPEKGEGSRSGRPTNGPDQEKIDIAFRAIADHIRTLSFAIADGIIPSNEGRGYVLRRILRRAVRYGRALGFHKPFFFNLVDVVAQTMGDVFLGVRAKKKTIQETIRREEESFNRTLDRGLELLDEATVDAVFKQAVATPSISHADVRTRYRHKFFSGRPGMETIEIFAEADNGALFDKVFKARPSISSKDAFELYDTYGFPLDLTELMVRERGLTVDVVGFEKLMNQQRERARKSQKKQVIELASDLGFVGNLEARKISGHEISTTKFLGYDFLETEAVVETVLPGQKPGEPAVVLDRTSCYAEMGGQVGDHGLLHVPGHDRTEVGHLRVIDTHKFGDVYVHFTELIDGRAPEPGEAVRVSVDAERRKLIQGHHTVTHLLHWALHQIVSKDATQKGSYVGPDKLTFDFSSAALTAQQKRDVEKLVNEKIAENAPVSWTEVPYAEARQREDIQQFFGEKYGDVVRVVQIGGEQKKLNGYSMELCGGTHVRSTGEIGPFRIVREEAIAAGIRRIEAVAGDAARDWAQLEAAKQQEKFDALARKKSDIVPLPAFSNEGGTAEMLKRIDARAAHLEKLDVDVREWEKKNAKAGDAQLKKHAAEIANELAVSCAGKDFCVTEVPNADGKLLGAVADALRTKFKAPIFLAGAIDGRVALIVAVPKEMTSKFQANKIIQEIAPIVGGKGGGRPENAQGAGTDASKINQALDRAKKVFMG